MYYLHIYPFMHVLLYIILILYIKMCEYSVIGKLLLFAQPTPIRNKLLRPRCLVKKIDAECSNKQ